MLGLLREDGPATATALAHRLGLNSGSTSYHLRQLAAHGFVVEDTGRGTARERWWRAGHRATRFDQAATGDDPRALGEAHVRAVGQRAADRIVEALDELPTLPERWRTAGNLSTYRLRVTPDELAHLLAQVAQVVRAYPADDAANGTDTDTAAAPPPEDAAPVVVQIQAFPSPGALTEHAEEGPA